MFSKLNSKRAFSQKLYNMQGIGYEVRNKLMIDGQWCDAKSGATFDLINPSTEQIITQVASAGKEDVDAAVSSCVDAQKEWKKVTPLHRAQIMNKFADSID